MRYISQIGKEMLSIQEQLANQYNYKKLPKMVSTKYQQMYYDTLPPYFKSNLNGSNVFLYDLHDICIATKYERIVIGDYGAFIEIAPENIIEGHLACKPGQEYRYEDNEYRKRVKYLWLTTCGDSNCKIYYQMNTVSYADYKPDYYYISPFECYFRVEENSMIYTTYFGNLKNLPKNIIPISICGKAPNWYKGLQYKKLAPKLWFFKEWKQNHDNKFYVKNFNKEVLDPLSATEVVLDLKHLCGKGLYSMVDIALVCYEKPGDFCHRHIVSKWLRANGYDCKEFN